MGKDASYLVKEMIRRTSFDLKYDHRPTPEELETWLQCVEVLYGGGESYAEG